MTTFVSDPLNSTERSKFLSRFFALEIAEGAEIRVRPVHHRRDPAMYQISIATLRKNGDSWKWLLRESFKDGVLGDWGGKFTCTQQ